MRVSRLCWVALPSLLFAADASLSNIMVQNDANTGVLTMQIVVSPTPDKLDASQIHILDLATNTSVGTSGFQFDGLTAQFQLDPTVNLKHRLLVIVDPVQIGGKATFVTPGPYTGKPVNVGATAPGPKKADSKDDALFYFDGEISHARTKDIVGSYDLKVSYAWTKRGLRRLWDLGPLFTLQGGNDPKGDPDSMQLGLTVNTALQFTGGSPFLALGWENTPQIESTRDYSFTNFVNTSRFKMVSRQWTPAKDTRFYMVPFSGIDFGRNLASEVVAARDQTILRLVAGSKLTFVVGLGGDASFNITGDYIRYWPINNEVLITTDKDGNILTPYLGTKARDHIKAGTGIDFNKWAGVKVSYERGSLPPAFKFVDNKLTLSLVIKVK